MSKCSNEQEEAWAVATLQTMTWYYFIIYGTNFAMAGAAPADVFPIPRR